MIGGAISSSHKAAYRQDIHPFITMVEPDGVQSSGSNGCMYRYYKIGNELDTVVDTRGFHDLVVTGCRGGDIYRA